MGQAALKNDFITEEEYLAGEELTEDWHEYVDGKVFAMAVPTDTHAEISGSIFLSVGSLLRGRRCRPFKGDMRVRIAFLDRKIHYIPDVVVACDDPPPDRRFREQPLAIWEVFSESSEQTDQREKLLAYTLLPTLRHYFMLRQDRMEIAHLCRTGERRQDWTETVFTAAGDMIEVPEIGYKQTLAEIYADAGL